MPVVGEGLHLAQGYNYNNKILIIFQQITNLLSRRVCIALHAWGSNTLSNGKAIYYPLKPSIMSNKKATNPPIEKAILLMGKQQMPTSLPLQKDDEGEQLGERRLICIIKNISRFCFNHFQNIVDYSTGFNLWFSPSRDLHTKIDGFQVKNLCLRASSLLITIK